MKSPAWLLVGCFALGPTACREKSGPPAAPTAPDPAVTPPAMMTSSATVRAPLDGYPLARLLVDDNPLEPLDLELDAKALATLAVKSHHSYSATAPRVWLVALEFASQAELLGAKEKLDTLFVHGSPPFYRESAYTGTWLLLTGFPSDKPVSPEMDEARGRFLQQWWGEE